jgi:hypothetical protein
MIAETVDSRSAALTGRLAFLDSGSGNAAIRIYGGVRRANTSDTPGSAMLVEIGLTKPCGTVSAGVLTLTQLADGLIAASGVGTWAIFVNGAGATAFDTDAGEGVGAWEVRLVNADLYAGGGARIVSAALG